MDAVDVINERIIFFIRPIDRSHVTTQINVILDISGQYYAVNFQVNNPSLKDEKFYKELHSNSICIEAREDLYFYLAQPVSANEHPILSRIFPKPWINPFI